MLFKPFCVTEGFTNSYKIDERNPNDANATFNSYKNVLTKRSKMDQQLAELNKEKNTIHQEHKKQYDRTMFAGMFLSILGTSLGYYVLQHV